MTFFEWLKRKLSRNGWLSAQEIRCENIILGKWNILIYYDYLDEFCDVSIRYSNILPWYHLNIKESGEWVSYVYPEKKKEDVKK